MDLKELTARINELARKSKAEGLTEDEKSEQAMLRRDYIDRVLRNMKEDLKGIKPKK